MFGRKTKEEKEIEKKYNKKIDKMIDADYVICPHCEKKINEKTGVYECYLGDKMGVSIHGCPHCKKSLGTYSSV